MMPFRLNRENYHQLCDQLASQDDELKAVLEHYGYPPLWSRENSFETLVHIILEQQVSLASALAALNKLKEKTTAITPQAILSLSDQQLRECFVSRQKTIYIRELAMALESKEISLDSFAEAPDEQVRKVLTGLKGIGNWTVDVYSMFALQHADIFPAGDLAAVNALKRLKQLGTATTKDEVIQISEGWKPYRTVATMILWHYYLSTSASKNSQPNTRL